MRAFVSLAIILVGCSVDRTVDRVCVAAGYVSDNRPVFECEEPPPDWFTEHGQCDFFNLDPALTYLQWTVAHLSGEPPPNEMGVIWPVDCAELYDALNALSYSVYQHNTSCR